MADYSPSDEDWADRAEELAETTVLSHRQAEVQALTEQHRSRQEIADELDVSINTVDEHRQKIKARVQLAENTVEELGNDKN